jgi:tetratricopeptide (TPR) repeat protein
MRLSPYYPDWYLETLGVAHLEAGEYEEAIAVLRKFLEREPSAVHAAHGLLAQAGAYDALGREQEARAAVAAALRFDPGLSVTSFSELSLRKDKAAVDRAVAILRRLGLPE